MALQGDKLLYDYKFVNKYIYIYIYIYIDRGASMSLPDILHY